MRVYGLLVNWASLAVVTVWPNGFCSERTLGRRGPVEQVVEAGETNLIVRSASHLPLILPVLRAYCSKKHIILMTLSGLKLIKIVLYSPNLGKNITILKLFASNPI